MNALSQLDEEHEQILDALCALERIAYAPAETTPFPSDDAASLVEFFRRFVDGAHHGKEESALFPALAASGISEEQGPLATVRAQHAEAKSLLQALADATAGAGRGRGPRGRFTRAAEAYAALLRTIIRKETFVLYHAARRRLGEDVLLTLLTDFERIEAATFSTESRTEVLCAMERLGVRRAAA